MTTRTGPLRTFAQAVAMMVAVILVAACGSNSTGTDAFLDQFSGNDSSVADYLTRESLSALPDDIQEFLRVISISDPVPSGRPPS